MLSMKDNIYLTQLFPSNEGYVICIHLVTQYWNKPVRYMTDLEGMLDKNILLGEHWSIQILTALTAT